MKPEIEQRMQTEITNATKWNQMFDTIVGVTETVFETTMTLVPDNMFEGTPTVGTTRLKISVICNDNVWDTIAVSINNFETDERYESLTIDLQGNIREEGVRDPSDQPSMNISMRSILQSTPKRNDCEYSGDYPRNIFFIFNNIKVYIIEHRMLDVPIKY